MRGESVRRRIGQIKLSGRKIKLSSLYIYEKMLKNIRQRKEAIVENLCFGSVSDFTAFKELRARLAELALTEQELKDLQNRMTENE